MKCYLILFWKQEDFDIVKEKLGDDYVLYFNYVRFCLEKLDFPDLKWTKHPGDEGWTFVVPAGRLSEYVEGADDYLFGVMHETKRVKGGMQSFSKEDIVKAWKEERILYRYPDELRLREYKIYVYWVKKYQDLKQRVEKAIVEALRDEF